MSALTKYQDAIAQAPCRGGGLHQHLMTIANLGILAELTSDQIISDSASLDKLKPNEMLNTVRKAFNTVDRQMEPIIEKKVSRFAPTVTDPLGKFIKGVSTDMVDLMELSPVMGEDPDDDAALVLTTLYQPEEVLFIGDVFGRKVQTVEAWLNDGGLSVFPHIIPNPMTGKEGMTGEAKISYRCESTVADLRYAVCEMDEVPLDKQVAFWIRCIKLGIPVAAVIHSGSKSLHGWVKVGCETDVDKWDKDVRGWLFEQFGKMYGLDKACSNKSRLSRLPSHYREGKEQQRLLYLNGDV